MVGIQVGQLLPEHRSAVSISRKVHYHELSRSKPCRFVDRDACDDGLLQIPWYLLALSLGNISLGFVSICFAAVFLTCLPRRVG